MPPRKKQEGLSRLIGKNISLGNTHDDVRVLAKFLSQDDSFIEVEVEGRIFFFNKNDITGITEDLSE